MARETDFLALYKQLGLNPGCDLAELKQAYRRRVAALHPDRESHRPAAPQAAEQLQRLTSLYGAAMDFQRRHNRLPGAKSAAATPRGPRSPVERRQPRAAQTTPHIGRWALIGLLLVVTGWWLWPTQSTPEPTSSSHTRQLSSLSETSVPAPAAAQALMLGMDARMVQLLQGTPVLISDDRWEYGPSWIRFENDKVVDWYSSPLQPLKVGASHPPPREPAPHPT